MPALSVEPPLSALPTSANSSFDLPNRKSHDKTISGVFTYTNVTDLETGLPDHRLEQIRTLKCASQNSLTNGNVKSGRDRAPSHTGSTLSVSSKNQKAADYFARTSTSADPSTRLSIVENASEFPRMNGTIHQHASSFENSTKAQSILTPNEADSDFNDPNPSRINARSQTKSTLYSSPPTMSPIALADENNLESIKTLEQSRLPQKHTLSIPQPTTGTVRASRDFSYTSGPSEEVLTSTGRFSDGDGSNVRRRRASMGLVRRSTRAASDARLEEVLPDEDAERWTEAIRQKRASRRRRQEEDDERVIVGKKVEEGHVNWVTAYNMLTGIRFTVSRTNAKIDRDLTDADFDAKQKMSFDVTGSEQTPGAKYDFKFKDYSPWVFRHLRHLFGLDPADYLMSLTSKYILSELGSPGKSGSFFYFSRDYRYIIKTIHHAEHKLLRKILRDYYSHVKNNPNTLISQFYGLHRVKIAYGRKVHFVVMNNLFPPHRDIHQTFDLKGSTIGREFREENLVGNPRATLKDLNWLRRDLHLEFDQRLREIFVEQLQKDVALLQRLQIMDYSLLVGMHNLDRGNEDNVREKTLQVFQPGGAKDEDDLSGHLMRTPSRLESARKARELRTNLKKEKPVPMELSTAKMPEHMGPDDQRHNRIFYSDDGGIRATHEDGRPGEMVYYLGVIDCLTHYGIVKRMEHFWKGLSNDRHQISPVPPHAYGERFLNFMTGITMTKEEAERRAQEEGRRSEISAHNILHHHHIPSKRSVEVQAEGTAEKLSHSPRNESAVEETLFEAQKSTDKQTGEKGRRRSEEEKPERTLLTHTNEARVSTTLPIVQEARENSSTHSAQTSRNSSTNRVESVEATEYHHLQMRDSGAHVSEHEHETLQNDDADKRMEYTVTSRDDEGEKRKEHIGAPLHSQEHLEARAEAHSGDQAHIDEQRTDRRISKPPRIQSGIVPTLTPMFREDEIGIAR